MFRRLLGPLIIGYTLLIAVSLAIGGYHVSSASKGLARANFLSGQINIYEQLPEAIYAESPSLRQDMNRTYHDFKVASGSSMINQSIALLAFGFGAIVLGLQLLTGIIICFRRATCPECGHVITAGGATT